MSFQNWQGKFYQIGFLLLFLIYVSTVEMRPGRLYYVLNYLFFRVSILDFFIYLALLAATCTSLLFLFLIRSKKVFYSFLAMLFLTLWLSLTYRLISGYNFMYADATVAFNNVGMADLALQNYINEIYLALFFAACVSGLLILLRKKTKFRFANRYGVFALILTPLIIWQIHQTNGIIDDVPAFFRVPSTMLVASINRLEQPARTDVSLKLANKSVPRIFLIVDESVTGGQLTINNPNVKTTPFLAGFKTRLFNFGITSSTTNQSNGSNIALMCGTRPEELPDKKRLTLRRPNIFQYAKKAGYTTYYLDGQLANNALQNYMSPEDLKYIDHFWQPGSAFPEQPRYMRDFLIAEKLIELTRSKKKVFVYAVKVGAHWPYGNAYPADSAFRKPVLSSRNMYKDRERTLNTYHNALRWTVDEFWKKLLTTIHSSDSVVAVYTSDHGQNLQEEGLSITHASIMNTKAQEAEVPLLLWDPAILLPQPFKPLSFSKYSHAAIFPTLLQLQGYSKEEVKERYGPSLLEPALPEERFFLSGDFFGQGPAHRIRF